MNKTLTEILKTLEEAKKYRHMADALEGLVIGAITDLLAIEAPKDQIEIQFKEDGE